MARAAAACVYLVAVVVLLGPSLSGSHVALPHDILMTQQPWAGLEGGSDEGIDGQENHELRDTIDHYYPIQGELVRRLRAGEDTSWVEQVGFGQPGLSFVGWGATSPFTLAPGLLLDWDLAWSWGQALRLLAAMVGAHLLARAYGVGRAGATVAGVSFGLSAFMVGWLGWPQSHVGALIPWVCWAALRTVAGSTGGGPPGRRVVAFPWWAPAALAVTTAGLWLGGFPSVAVYALLAAGMVALHAAVRGPGGMPRLLLALAGVVVGSLLVAAILVPSVGYLGELDLTGRNGAWRAKVFPTSLLTFVVPALFGDHVSGDRWLGSAWVETVGYAGVVTLLCALPAWLTGPRLRGLGLWSAMGVGFTLVAYGFPPTRAVLQHLPLLSTNPPSRVLVLVGLAIALVGGMGVDALLRLMARRARLGGLRTVATLVLVAFGVGMLAASDLLGYLGDALTAFAEDTEERQLLYETAVNHTLTAAWFVTAALAVVLIAGGVSRWSPRWGVRLSGPALVLIVAADLVTAANGWNVQSPRGELFPEAPGIAEAQGAAPARTAGADGVGLPNANLQYPGWHDLRARGFLTTRQRAVLRNSGTQFRSATNWDLTTVEVQQWDPWLAVAGVSSVLAPGGAQLPGDWPTTDLEGGMVQRVTVPGALSRVSVRGTAEASDTSAAAVRREGVAGLADLTIVEAWPGTELPPLPEGSSATLEEWARDGGRLTATVESDDGAVLVLRDAALRGWSATVDGENSPLVVADHLFVGAVVPPGTREVTLAYRPVDQDLGWALSAAGGVGLLLLGVAGVATRRRRKADQAPG